MDWLLHEISYGRGWYFHAVCDPDNLFDAVLHSCKLGKHSEEHQGIYDRIPVVGNLYDRCVLCT